MINSFKTFLFDKLDVHPESKLLLAVSGGMDSMCLWDLCRKSDLKISVAHCNFMLRGEASDLDAEFVKKHARKEEEVFIKSFDTKAYSKEKSISIQMAARELRYAWFGELKENHGFDFIATAHHLDDQVETFFIQLLRKSNLPALAGMPVRTSKLIRPLMFTTRESIENYVSTHKLEYREDQSNDSEVYLRNRIRKNLLPALQKVLPDFKMSVLELMSNMKAYSEEMEDYFDRKEMELAEYRGGEWKIEIDALKKMDFPILFLEHFLRKFGFTQTVARNLYDGLDGPSGKVFYSKSHRILKDRTYILGSPLNLNEDDLIRISKKVLTEQSDFFLNAEVLPYAEEVMNRAGEGVALLDFDLLEEELTFRKWQAGDYFYPLGMGGKKKLSDYFIDRKFSLKDKENQWIMTSGDEICWIVGRNIDDRYKIRDNTKVVLILEQH